MTSDTGGRLFLSVTVFLLLCGLCGGIKGEDDDVLESTCTRTPPAGALETANAIRMLRMCIRLRPFDIEARMDLAAHYAIINDAYSSARVLRGVLALPVNDAAALDAHNALGVILDRSQGHTQHAELHLRAALAIDPAYTPAMLNLGNCMWKQRRTSDALELFDRAIRLAPAESDFHYSLATAQFELGRASVAAEGFRRALLLAPSNAHALLGTHPGRALLVRLCLTRHTPIVRGCMSAELHQSLAASICVLVEQLAARY